MEKTQVIPDELQPQFEIDDNLRPEETLLTTNKQEFSPAKGQKDVELTQFEPEDNLRQGGILSFPKKKNICQPNDQKLYNWYHMKM